MIRVDRHNGELTKMKTKLFLALCELEMPILKCKIINKFDYR